MFWRDCDILAVIANDKASRFAFSPGAVGMKVVSFLLLLAGWFLVLSSIVLLPSPAARGAFVFAGVGVEALGLVLLFRSHAIPREEKG